jgi:hypothetical protein
MGGILSFEVVNEGKTRTSDINSEPLTPKKRSEIAFQPF